MLERSAGVLMALSSLPSPYGVGGLGAPARAFVDFLAAAGQRWWQLLPVSPLGEGGSPYQSCSAFAGEPLYLDLEDLTEQGLITAEELAGQRLDSPDAAAFEEARALRMPLLRKAWRRAGSLPLGEEPFWLEDYVRYVSRRAGDLEEGEFHRFLQLQFLRQWDALRDYAGARGVRLMGDIPIYLSLDSAEVQAHPELFQLDGAGRLARVAGVPPDAFSREGQLWGSPLYDWAGNPGGTAAFWRDRARWAARLYDGVRLDHFRGFYNYWSVPAGRPATAGRWEPGPGRELIDAIRAAAPELFLLAEDLGDLDEGARAFPAACGVPGMRVLVFAFDSGPDNAYLPHNCPEDCAVYTGTHDTPTFVEFLQTAAPETAAFARAYLRLREDEGLGWGALAGAWGSPAALAIAPLQDVLGLGGDARMNLPGTVGGRNWRWRVREEALNPGVAARLRELTRVYGRLRG